MHKLPIIKNINLQTYQRFNYISLTKLSAHKFKSSIIPNVLKNKLNVLFNYLNNHKKLYLKRYNNSTFSLNKVFKKSSNNHENPYKLTFERIIPGRKNFLKTKLIYFRKARHSFLFGVQKKNSIKKLIYKLCKKSSFAVNSILNFNIQSIVLRVFPFISRTLCKLIIKSGLVKVNTSLYFNDHVKKGDFIRILVCKKFLKKYKNLIRSHRFYLKGLGKHIYRFFKSQRQKFHLRRKNYLNMYFKYTRFYKKIPTWLEVSFISMSVFIVKTPIKLYFNRVNYNHYLSRLLFFR